MGLVRPSGWLPAGVGLPAPHGGAAAGSGLCPASQPRNRASHTGWHAVPLNSTRSWDPKLYTLGLLSRAQGLPSLNNYPVSHIIWFKYQITVTKKSPELCTPGHEEHQSLKCRFSKK